MKAKSRSNAKEIEKMTSIKECKRIHKGTAEKCNTCIDRYICLLEDAQPIKIPNISFKNCKKLIISIGEWEGENDDFYSWWETMEEKDIDDNVDDEIKKHLLEVQVDNDTGNVMSIRIVTRS